MHTHTHIHTYAYMCTCTHTHTHTHYFRSIEEVGRQHQGMERPGVWQVPEGSGEQGKMEKTGCKIICGAPTTHAVKGLMMVMMSLSCVLEILNYFKATWP